MAEPLWGLGSSPSTSNVPQPAGTGLPKDLSEFAQPVGGLASDIIHGRISSQEVVRARLGEILFLGGPASDDQVNEVLSSLANDLSTEKYNSPLNDLGPGAASLMKDIYSQALIAYHSLPETDKSLW